MEHASAVALGGWRERLRGLSVRRETLDDLLPDAPDGLDDHARDSLDRRPDGGRA
jgi:hypothetical protein